MNANRRPFSSKPKRWTANVALVLATPLGVLSPACDTKDDAQKAAASASAAAPAPPSATSSAAPPPAAAPNGSNAPGYDPMATMFGTMATELKNRSNVHPSVDDGFAALTKAGITVVTPKQSLATTYKAAYCSHGVTSAGDLSVLLCEYPDEAHAAAGLAESRKLFATLTTRETLSHKSLVLVTIFQLPDHSPAAVAEQQKVVATFNAL